MKHFPEGIHWRQQLFFFTLQTVTSNLFIKVSAPRVGELGIIRLLPQSCSLLFSKLLLYFVDYIGQTWLASVASGWVGTSVALTGNQKAGEWSGWGTHLASPVLEGVHPLPEPAPVGSSLPLSPRAGSSPVVDRPQDASLSLWGSFNPTHTSK